MAKKKTGGGGKLARSEVVTVRFDPRVRFALELASRVQRRTVSSLIEWAVDRTLREVKTQAPDGRETPISQLLSQIWDVDEADRFLNLALTAPELLTFEEQRIWKHIHKFKSELWKNDTPDRGAIRRNWEKIKKFQSISWFTPSDNY